eukprot:COSAG02_NODE_48245_length_335_cov_0.762712_1_plen_40_part_10
MYRLEEEEEGADRRTWQSFGESESQSALAIPNRQKSATRA